MFHETSRMTEKGKLSEVRWKFDWQIENFFSITDESYRSPEFHVSDSSWYIGIFNRYPPKKDQHDPSYVSIYLKREDNGTPENASFRIGIKTVNKAIEYEKVAARYVSCEYFGWENFIYRSELLRRRTELVPSGILTITCFVMVKSTEPDLDLSHRKLAKSMKRLFTSKENSDVKFYVKTRKILAHRNILSARSRVFADMFRDDTIERKTGVVKIPDCNIEAFNMFLLYLYSGEVDFSKCNVYELYKIAFKHSDRTLMLMCANFMLENLSVDNFCKIFLFVTDYHIVKLLDGVQNFFNQNFEKIVSSKRWEFFMKNNYLRANTLLKQMAPKINIMQ